MKDELKKAIEASIIAYLCEIQNNNWGWTKKWNPRDVAKKTLENIEQEQNGGEKTLKDLYNKVWNILMDSFNWEQISENAERAAKRILMQQIKNESKDVVQDVMVIIKKSWDPIKETDWENPVVRFAKKTAINIAHEHNRIYERRRTFTILNTKRQILVKNTKVNSTFTKQQLAADIDEYLYRKLSPLVATAFILDIGFNVHDKLCGIIAHPKVAKGKKMKKMKSINFRDFWYHKREKIKKGLKKFLEDKGYIGFNHD